jgi:hypothetical protein
MFSQQNNKNNGENQRKIHVVFEIRQWNMDKKAMKKKSQDAQTLASIRRIKNINEVLSSLRSIPDISLTPKDMSELSFIEQYALVNSADVFISMHGAGTFKIFE